MRTRFLVITSVIFNLERSFLHQYDPLEHGKLVSDDFECHQGILVENRHQLCGSGSEFMVKCRSYQVSSVMIGVQIIQNSKNHNCTVTED